MFKIKTFVKCLSTLELVGKLALSLYFYNRSVQFSCLIDFNLDEIKVALNFKAVGDEMFNICRILINTAECEDQLSTRGQKGN